jgi:hypothetical protein
MSRIQCALYCKLWAKCSAHPPDNATWIVVPAICSAITAPHIQTSILNWTYLRGYWRYLGNSTRVIPQAWCKIQRTSSRLRYVNCGPGHIQCNYSSTYSGFNIRLNVSALLLEICRQFGERYTANLVPIQRTTTSLRNVNCGRGHIQWIYSSTYSGFNIQLNISPPLLEIYRQFHVSYTATLVAIERTASCLRSVNCGPGHIHCEYCAAYSGINIQLKVSVLILEICRQFSEPYTANLVPNTVHNLQIKQCALWSRP